MSDEFLKNILSKTQIQSLWELNLASFLKEIENTSQVDGQRVKTSIGKCRFHLFDISEF